MGPVRLFVHYKRRKRDTNGELPRKKHHTSTCSITSAPKPITASHSKEGRFRKRNSSLGHAKSLKKNLKVIVCSSFLRIVSRFLLKTFLWRIFTEVTDKMTFSVVQLFWYRSPTASPNRFMSAAPSPGTSSFTSFLPTRSPELDSQVLYT